MFPKILDIVIICENQIISQNIKTSLEKHNLKILLKTFREFSENPEATKPEIFFIELAENFEEKIKLISQVKSKLKNSKIIGIASPEIFEKAVDSVKLGIDYLLTTPLKYQFLPHLISKIAF